MLDFSQFQPCQDSETLLREFPIAHKLLSSCWCPLPSNVASPVTAPAVASIVCLFRGLPSKTKENTNKDQILS